ncbi:PAS domain-containing response regulator [Methanobacterium petrolearium]|uniref:PAS domain-containing response regulator n=1 Tax=Methanobacterium petrolearium TaxID=710190 RepID=UPI001AEAA4FB|nr:PAS domain S-box protein [Methanobacterium petrolearium]MBP1945408.1 PAS domain S-box-containing protein [Methanobacterium petrolearium]BDZ71604.1 hypothetical protein GCM10025861_21210 [Methanobacterium petrolearium]
MNNNEIKVLLVEDNPGDTALIREMFLEIPKISFNVSQAENLKDALDAAHHNHFDIILLDLHLPDSHGTRTFTSVQQVAPHIPIIILTGLEDEEFGIKLVGEGAQDYLVKGQVDSLILARSIKYSIERKHILSKLRENEEKYRSMIEKIHSGVFLINLRNQLSYVNREMAKMLGYNVKEMINKDISNFIKPDGESIFNDHLHNITKRTKEKENLAQTYELEFIKKDGTTLWGLVSTNPVFKPNKQYLGAISIITDISSRKGIEKSLMTAMIEKDRDFFLIMGNMVEAMKPLIQENHDVIEFEDKFT